jgi:hypothetical protein
MYDNGLDKPYIIKTRSCKLKMNCQSANIEEEEELLLIYS